MPSKIVDVCPDGGWIEAIELLFSDLSRVDREWQTERLLRDVEQGTIRLDGLLTCKEQGRLVGATLAMVQPGRSVFAWPPKSASGVPRSEQSAIAIELLAGVERFAVGKGARFIQALINRSEKDPELAFAAAGFYRLATLLYLKRELSQLPPFAPLSGVEYQTFEPGLRDEFISVLEQSYVESSDCPELTGVRAPHEILESHRAQGEFRADHWMLLRADGRWVGCLLLAGLSELDAIEVAYVAVLPEARGKGFGRELTRRAIELAQRTGARWLTLAVDRRNRAARRLYDQIGFERWDERDAHLLVLDPADGNLDRWRRDGGLQ